MATQEVATQETFCVATKEIDCVATDDQSTWFNVEPCYLQYPNWMQIKNMFHEKETAYIAFRNACRPVELCNDTTKVVDAEAGLAAADRSIDHCEYNKVDLTSSIAQLSELLDKTKEAIESHHVQRSEFVARISADEEINRLKEAQQDRDKKMAEISKPAFHEQLLLLLSTIVEVGVNDSTSTLAGKLLCTIQNNSTVIDRAPSSTSVLPPSVSSALVPAPATPIGVIDENPTRFVIGDGVPAPRTPIELHEPKAKAPPPGPPGPPVHAGMPPAPPLPAPALSDPFGVLGDPGSAPFDGYSEGEDGGMGEGLEWGDMDPNVRRKLSVRTSDSSPVKKPRPSGEDVSVLSSSGSEEVGSLPDKDEAESSPFAGLSDNRQRKMRREMKEIEKQEENCRKSFQAKRDRLKSSYSK